MHNRKSFRSCLQHYKTVIQLLWLIKILLYLLDLAHTFATCVLNCGMLKTFVSAQILEHYEWAEGALYAILFSQSRRILKALLFLSGASYGYSKQNRSSPRKKYAGLLTQKNNFIDYFSSNFMKNVHCSLMFHEGLSGNIIQIHTLCSVYNQMGKLEFSEAIVHNAAEYRFNHCMKKTWLKVK